MKFRTITAGRFMLSWRIARGYRSAYVGPSDAYPGDYWFFVGPLELHFVVRPAGRSWS